MDKKVELLLPAGNIEKLDYAINYGADAVYMGMVDFSLRSMRKGEIITQDNLKKAIELAHSYNKKVYMTLNIYAYDEDIKNLYENIEIIKDANPDALIVSDFGIFECIEKQTSQYRYTHKHTNKYSELGSCKILERFWCNTCNISKRIVDKTAWRNKKKCS